MSVARDAGNVGSAVGEISVSEVSERWPSLSRRVLTVKNQMSYSAADAVAAAYGGDTSLIPRFMGFVYGSSPNANGLSSGDDRDMRWDTLKDQLADIGGNVQIARFSSAPFVSSDNRGIYSGNTVTFQACTRSGPAAEYGFATNGQRFAGMMSGGDNGSRMYQALLLGLPPGQECEEEKRYLILARATLSTTVDSVGSTVYRTKPNGYELAVTWRVSFY